MLKLGTGTSLKVGHWPSRAAVGSVVWQPAPATQKPAAQVAYSAAKSAQFILLSDRKRYAFGHIQPQHSALGILFIKYGSTEYIHVLFCISL